MATVSRVTPQGWLQWDDGADAARVGPAGWIQIVAAGGAGGAAITLQSDGTLQQKPSPAGSDRKLYLTSAGAIEAKTAAGGGDRRISAATGTWTAH